MVWRRLATWVLEGVGRRRWGFPPRIMSAVVEQLGPLSALWWMLANMSDYEKAREQLGPLRTHLLVTGISLLHGCSYCTYSHAYALQLVYFDRFERLLPLDEHELVQLRGLDDFNLRMRFDRLLSQAGLADEIHAFDRMVALVTDQAIGELPDDEHLRHLVQMFAVLSLVGRRSNLEPDHAHDPIHKAAELVARYQEERSMARLSVPMAA